MRIDRRRARSLLLLALLAGLTLGLPRPPGCRGVPRPPRPPTPPHPEAPAVPGAAAGPTAPQAAAPVHAAR